MTQQKIITRYLRQVKRNCPFSIRRKQTAGLANDLTEYLEAHPGGTLEDVVNYFGTPGEFADAYYLAMEEPERRKALRSAHWVKRTCIVTAIVLLLIIAVTLFGIHYMNTHRTVHYIYKHSTQYSRSSHNDTAKDYCLLPAAGKAKLSIFYPEETGLRARQ